MAQPFMASEMVLLLAQGFSDLVCGVAVLRHKALQFIFGNTQLPRPIYDLIILGEVDVRLIFWPSFGQIVRHVQLPVPQCRCLVNQAAQGRLGCMRNCGGYPSIIRWLIIRTTTEAGPLQCLAKSDSAARHRASAPECRTGYFALSVSSSNFTVSGFWFRAALIAMRTSSP